MKVMSSEIDRQAWLHEPSSRTREAQLLKSEDVIDDHKCRGRQCALGRAVGRLRRSVFNLPANTSIVFAFASLLRWAPVCTSIEITLERKL